MISTLYVAAGGGGDAIAAAILANRAAPGEPAAIATYAWDRLIIDPLPGPRGAQDFYGLIGHAPHVWEITPLTEPKPPAGSTLPGLARELHARLFLLDPYGGAIGMAQQLRSIAGFLDAESLALVDVGGDLVGRGDEPELRSPLADALALTACELTTLPYEAIVAGPGVDGELSERQVIERCRDLGGNDLAALSEADVEPYAAIFDWHPSEATGLWTAAARHHRGRVEIRDAGLPVTLTDATPHVYAVRVGALVTGNIFVEPLTRTRSLDQAEDVVRAIRGSTEIDYERRKAAKTPHVVMATTDAALISRVNQVTEDATQRTDYLTVRRLAELTSVSSQRLIRCLRATAPDLLAPPLWKVGL